MYLVFTISFVAILLAVVLASLRRRPSLRSRLAYAFLERRVFREPLILTIDAILAAISLTLAISIWSDAEVQPFSWAHIYSLVLTAAAIRVILILAFWLQRWSFRMSGLHEGLRLAVATACGTVALALVGHFAQPALLRAPVLLLDFFFMITLAGIFRFVPRWCLFWLSNLDRSRRNGAQRAIIVGAGRSGDLLLRDLVHSTDHRYHVVGFVDDLPARARTSMSGKPVLGTTRRLAELIAHHHVEKVLIAEPRFPAARIRQLVNDCAHSKVSFKIIPASFSYLDDRISAALLKDLKPEDLLPRESVTFDRTEARALVSGRRILITGAGGSIGSEVARQLAANQPEELVLVDMNENELYLLTRSLQERHPTLPIAAVVADIRDRRRMKHLGEQYRPQDVFHAAAHKHVPLMEDAPEEAVKNNIFGTLHVAQMADACRAERFVLISTDKAVAPSSVMGVSKRVAELIVRDFASRSKTRFTAVRFGNVLGSAGSVLPLFKQQIERGGPVTVTDPHCTRFFMTIPEAVGLVIIAGLGGYGDLCILDMGEPIRIADLARNIIVLSGRGSDIAIHYTGLRPGEKLAERLLTEDEESVMTVRNKIMVCNSPSPPFDLALQLAMLEAAAAAPDRVAITRLLQTIVPTYKPSPRVPSAPQPQPQPQPQPEALAPGGGR
jgi:FlaA1/EpsC-like NDP-sugar epimerase